MAYFSRTSHDLAIATCSSVDRLSVYDNTDPFSALYQSNGIQNYDKKLYKISMTMKRQDILEKLEHTMQYANTIGGQDYIHS